MKSHSAPSRIELLSVLGLEPLGDDQPGRDRPSPLPDRDLPTVDLFGLTNRRIARGPTVAIRSLPGHHEMLTGSPLDELRPDLAFLDLGASVGATPRAVLPWSPERALFEQPAFSEHYRLTALPTAGGFVSAYRRVNTARATRQGAARPASALRSAGESAE